MGYVKISTLTSMKILAWQSLLYYLLLRTFHLSWMSNVESEIGTNLVWSWLAEIRAPSGSLGTVPCSWGRRLSRRGVGAGYLWPHPLHDCPPETYMLLITLYVCAGFVIGNNSNLIFSEYMRWYFFENTRFHLLTNILKLCIIRKYTLSIFL